MQVGSPPLPSHWVPVPPSFSIRQMHRLMSVSDEMNEESQRFPAVTNKPLSVLSTFRMDVEREVHELTLQGSARDE